MIGRTNTGAGGGSCLALIRVLYKAGTNATCTNGTITFLSDQSGDYLFLLPVAGTWTVTGTSASDVVKTITVTLARGDAKTITIDTLIPPAYRSTYREVEYIQALDVLISVKPNLPLGVQIAPGSWDFEMENLWLKQPPNQYVMALNAGGLMLCCPTQYIQISSSSGSLVASKVITTETNRNYVIHWSSVTETEPISLTVDGEKLVSASSAGFVNVYELYAFGNIGTWSNSWPGRYGAIKTTLNGTLLHHFIPAKRIADGMPGYFDLLTNDFKQGYQDQDGTIGKVLEVMTPGPEIGT